MRIAVQFDVQPSYDFNNAASSVTRGIEQLGYLIELGPGQDYTWIGLVEDVPESDAGQLREQIERLLSRVAGVECDNVLIMNSPREPEIGPLGPRSRPSGLAERMFAGV